MLKYIQGIKGFFKRKCSNSRIVDLSIDENPPLSQSIKDLIDVHYLKTG